MPRYTKERIVEFVEEGIITPIKDISPFLERCKNDEEKALLILLYYTGARPIELSLLKPDDVDIDEKSVVVTIRTKKRGRARRLLLPLNKYNKFVYEYAKTQHEVLFPKFVNPHRIRDFVYRISDGQLSPYFFRHNRMSLLAMKGADARQIKLFKGAKDIKSVEPYLHLSKREMEQLRDLME